MNDALRKVGKVVLQFLWQLWMRTIGGLLTLIVFGFLIVYHKLRGKNNGKKQ